MNAQCRCYCSNRPASPSRIAVISKHSRRCCFYALHHENRLRSPSPTQQSIEPPPALSSRSGPLRGSTGHCGRCRRRRPFPNALGRGKLAPQLGDLAGLVLDLALVELHPCPEPCVLRFQVFEQLATCRIFPPAGKSRSIWSVGRLVGRLVGWRPTNQRHIPHTAEPLAGQRAAPDAQPHGFSADSQHRGGFVQRHAVGGSVGHNANHTTDRPSIPIDALYRLTVYRPVVLYSRN
jgi:hypothetical protein